MSTRITKLFGIQYPIISGGMVWCSGHELATAVSEAGGLGLIGAGSMYPETLRDHIRKVQSATSKPFGVNIPMQYPEVEKLIEIVIEEKVPVVFTSAGNPKTWTSKLQEHGIKVAHVVSNTKFARKCEEAGVDAIVAEGFEAGGHNGREETTTLCLVPAVSAAVSTPVIAAGGIYDGRTLAASMCLGAEGVQVGTAFALSEESSAHVSFKEHSLALDEGGTKLLLKKVVPTRLSANDWRGRVEEAEDRGATKEELREILGRGRAKKGIFEGDLVEGELEIGQVSANIHELLPVREIVRRMMEGYRDAVQHLPSL